MINTFIAVLFKKLIKLYQKYISAITPAACRYYPTCSQYGIHALTWHGGIKGTSLTIKRMSRCHPLGGHGVDFVPLPLYRFTFKYVSSQTVKQYKQHYVYVSTLDYRHMLNIWLQTSHF